MIVAFSMSSMFSIVKGWPHGQLLLVLRDSNAASCANRTDSALDSATLETDRSSHGRASSEGVLVPQPFPKDLFQYVHRPPQILET